MCEFIQLLYKDNNVDRIVIKRSLDIHLYYKKVQAEFLSYFINILTELFSLRKELWDNK
jgi:hypothetical protein